MVGFLIVLLLLIGGLILWFVLTYNGLIGLRNRVKNAWRQIDVQLKRRYDLIPNLVEVVKDYMAYEQETLEKVIKARNVALAAQGVKEQAQAENMLSGALKSLFAVVERYPDLKANQNVGKLQEELTHTENNIAFARQYYNDIVTQYNTRIQVVPANIVANISGFKEETLFAVEGEERENVKVDLR